MFVEGVVESMHMLVLAGGMAVGIGMLAVRPPPEEKAASAL